MYIIISEKTNKYYTGCCRNIDSRIKEHNGNQTKSTRFKGPYKLVYKEVYELKKDAIKREKEIKRYKGGRAFKKLTSVPIV